MGIAYEGEDGMKQRAREKKEKEARRVKTDEQSKEKIVNKTRDQSGEDAKGVPVYDSIEWSCEQKRSQKV